MEMISLMHGDTEAICALGVRKIRLGGARELEAD